MSSNIQIKKKQKTKDLWGKHHVNVDFFSLFFASLFSKSGIIIEKKSQQKNTSILLMELEVGKLPMFNS